jgi:isopenicillin-N epimerase
VLSTDLEYGACDLAWRWTCERAGARYIRANVPLPLVCAADVVDALFAERTEHTRAVFVSHITSETALVLPVEEIVARARAEGLVSIVDGAHAPGHLPLDLESLGADFYAGNCHKWLLAPKGSGFLHVRREWQELVDGPIVSWGYEEPATFASRTREQGTRDDAAYLTVPDAIAFRQTHDSGESRVSLAHRARAELCDLLDTEPLAPDDFILQMAAVRLPQPDPELSQRLFDEHRIEIPTMSPQNHLLRISIALYTEWEDVERLLEALPVSLHAGARRRAR